MSTNDDAHGMGQAGRQPVRGQWLEIGLWVAMTLGVLVAVLIKHVVGPRH